MQGKYIRTPEGRANMSAAHVGKSPSAEAKAKLSAALLGHGVTPETRAKIATSHIGKKLSDETRAKIGVAHRGFKHSPETRAKMSSDRKGKFSGMNSSNWKGGRYINSGGYVLIHCPDHPFNNGGYVREHRLVMEGILGRYLEPSELVHHKNQAKNDNRPENLELVVHTNHYGEVLCPLCQGHFLIK